MPYPMEKSKLTIDDLKDDILKLIDKVEALEQKIINVNFKLNQKYAEFEISRSVLFRKLNNLKEKVYG